MVFGDRQCMAGGTTVCCFLLVFVFLASVHATVDVLGAEFPDAITDQYIVAFHSNVTDDTRNKHIETVRTLQDGNDRPQIRFQYHIGDFKGYSARMNTRLLDQVRRLSEVKYVEHNKIVQSYQECREQHNATWGIVRTNQRSLLLDGLYNYNKTAGLGVDAYIIDTGIYLQHEDFSNRAEWGHDFVDSSDSPKTDVNGHGTHIAGTIMSDTYGLAKYATAIAVRVLSKSGAGTLEGVIGGVNYAVDQRKSRHRPAVANMALGTSLSRSMNDAVNAAVNEGVIVVVAAGQSTDDACNFSPASAEKAITVGSTNRHDESSSNSNYGTCINLFAPGTNITSTWIGSSTAVNTVSGTSMSSAHVSGVAVKYLSQYPASTPGQVLKHLEESATDGKIKNLHPSTPNKLVFMNCTEPTLVQ